MHFRKELYKYSARKITEWVQLVKEKLSLDPGNFGRMYSLDIDKISYQYSHQDLC